MINHLQKFISALVVSVFVLYVVFMGFAVRAHIPADKPLLPVEELKEGGSIFVSIPSVFSLRVGQTAKIANYQNFEIRLDSVKALPDCVGDVCPDAPFAEVAEIWVFSPGGCGPNADPACLGPPGFANNYIIPAGNYEDVLGMRIAVQDVVQQAARFEVSLSHQTSSCGNFVCDKGEDKSNCAVDCKEQCSGEACQGVVSVTISPEEISSIIASDAAVQKEKIEDIEKIELLPKETKQTYQVTAKRRAKLFLFIPVQMKVVFVVDAASGAIESIKKPWWSFLAK